ncbi:MAG: DUF1176 domain-containing protein [Pseudomonadota bacterium]|nr:DUF1176 domain-containing protein [Pseudomonadota bacterium]
MRFLFWLIIGATIGLNHAQAADAYLDDRSTPESLIRSLYNAINMHQYGRAYGYFADAPAKDFETYSKGFETTIHVDVLLGQSGGDGAAGSIYFNMPIAIRATTTDGKVSYFAGCYTVRAINADQDPPYTPLQIQAHNLKPIKADDYATYGLPKCSDVPPSDATVALDKDQLIAKAKAQFVSENSAACDKTIETQAGLNEPKVFPISYHLSSDEAKDAPHQATLFKFVCSMAAYNETDIFYLADSESTLSRLSFAEPQMDISYVGGDDSKLKSMKVNAMKASDSLINADFDPKSNEISNFAKWRGTGDASSGGTWALNEGEFVLQNYQVDPTYDEKQNPIAVMKYGQIVLKP